LCIGLKITKSFRFWPRVRVRKGSYTFEGTLLGPSEKKFPRGPTGRPTAASSKAVTFRLDFAWWDWKIMRSERRKRRRE